MDEKEIIDFFDKLDYRPEHNKYLFEKFGENKKVKSGKLTLKSYKF